MRAVSTCSADRSGDVVSAVLAEVDGHSGRHLVELDAGVWSCSCSAVGVCAHVVAVRLVSRDVVDLAQAVAS